MQFDIKYINLAHREDRRLHVESQLKGIGFVADRVEAIKLDDTKLACNLSHLKALKESKGTTLILEDDVWFSDYFNELEQTLNDLPSDWKLFYLGANHRTYPKHIKGHLAEAIEPYCTHAYIVNGNFREELINILETDKRVTDVVYCDLIQQGLKAYCSNPGLAFQLPSFSDIEGRFMSYEFMVPNRDREKLERLIGISLEWT